MKENNELCGWNYKRALNVWRWLKESDRLLSKNKNNAKAIRRIKMTTNAKWVEQRDYKMNNFQLFFYYSVFIRLSSKIFLYNIDLTDLHIIIKLCSICLIF